METNTNSEVTVSCKQFINVIAAEAAQEAAVSLLNKHAADTELRAAVKGASSTLSAYMFQMLRGGEQAQAFDDAREGWYARAEAAGIEVNRKSNSVAQIVSKAKALIGTDAIKRAGSLGEAGKLQKQAKDEAEQAEQDARIAEEQAVALANPDYVQHTARGWLEALAALSPSHLRTLVEEFAPKPAKPGKDAPVE